MIRRIGFVPDPAATAQEARELMRAEGIRPEDNIASTEIIRMRYGSIEEYEATVESVNPAFA